MIAARSWSGNAMYPPQFQSLHDERRYKVALKESSVHKSLIVPEPHAPMAAGNSGIIGGFDREEPAQAGARIWRIQRRSSDWNLQVHGATSQTQRDGPWQLPVSLSRLRKPTSIRPVGVAIFTPPITRTSARCTWSLPCGRDRRRSAVDRHADGTAAARPANLSQPACLRRLHHGARPDHDLFHGDAGAPTWRSRA